MYFDKGSGKKLNLSKTEFIILGPLKERLSQQIHICQIKIKQDMIKCLSIYLCHAENGCNKKIWLCIPNEIEKRLDSWRGRILTILKM